MLYLVEKFGLLEAWMLLTTVQVLRYTLVAGGLFVLFYLLKPRRWAHRKIQWRMPIAKDIRRDIGYSIGTILIFGGYGILVHLLRQQGLTRMYEDIGEYGWWYLPISVVLMLFLHDTYFYWTHRLMHHPRLFGLFHRVHHLSHNPSPWTTFAFHPLEALVEGGIILLGVMVVPLHALGIFLFVTISLLISVLGHLGYEIYPKTYHRHFLGSWQNTSTHHNMHHQYGRHNYGLYFNFWDRWMGTNHPAYQARFEEVAGRQADSSTAS